MLGTGKLGAIVRLRYPDEHQKSSKDSRPHSYYKLDSCIRVDI